MEPTLRIHLVAGFPYEAKQQVLAALPCVMDVCRPELGQSPCGQVGRVAVVLPAHVEPAPLVEAWTDVSAVSAWAGRPARLEGTTTILDAAQLERDLESEDLLVRRGWAAHPDDRRSVADLLLEQVESCDRILVAGDRAAIDRHRRWIEVLNPDSPVLDLAGGLAVLSEPVDGRRPCPAWRRAMEGAERASSSGPATAWVYRRRGPFEPERFRRWLAGGSPGVLRAKGRIWLADQPDVMLGYSRAAAVQRVFVAGRWWGSVPARCWPADDEVRGQLLARWHPRFGDRTQEIALVGPDLDPGRMEATLDACLATEAELERMCAAPSWADRDPSRVSGFH